MRLEVTNPWWTGGEDPVITDWNDLSMKWVPGIVGTLFTIHDSGTPGLHFLTGPRQVGKTTALHLFIQALLQNGTDPFSICYFQCDELNDHHELGEVIDSFLATRKARGAGRCVLVFDEVTFVKEWWRAVKARVDTRQVKDDTIVVTGSASLDLIAQKEKFPGRRGSGIDAVLLPLDFHDYASLHVNGLGAAPLQRPIDVDTTCAPNKVFSGRLEELFKQYLQTGGFPAPLQEFNRDGAVSRGTRRSFLAWINGDMQSASKSTAFAKEVIQYLLSARASPISWLSISKQTSIQSPTTVKAYIDLLEDIYAIKTLHLLNQQQRVEYRKNKKVHFMDPFLYRVFSEYTGIEVLDEHVAEGVLATHLARSFPTYYWRNGSEIDAVALVGGAPVGFEAKFGIGRPWRRVLHLPEQFVLDKATMPLFLASVKWAPPDHGGRA